MDKWKPIETAPMNGIRILIAHKLAEDDEEYEIDTAAIWKKADGSLTCKAELGFDPYPEYWQPLPGQPK